MIDRDMIQSDSCRLRIAGIGIELNWEGTRMSEEATQKFYRPFLAKGKSHSQLRIHCGEPPRLVPEATVFDAVRNHWQLSRLNGRYLLELFDTWPPHAKVQSALMALDFSQGEVYRRPDKGLPERSWSLSRLMRPFGEILLVNLLSQRRGVLVHGLAVSDGGRGLLFVGPSGAGKSTLANLYKSRQDVAVLGDERVVVTQIGGELYLSGTPWPGGAFSVSPETVPLKKVFFIEHGTRNQLIEEPLIRLSSLLVQQLFLPFWNGGALAFSLGLVEKLLIETPSYRLPFVNDETVIDFLRE